MSNKSKLPLIVMIHGWGFDSGVFEAINNVFEKNYRTQRINLPGYGGERLLSKYSLAELARYVDRDVLEPAIFIGWSMGGLVALELAKSNPDLVLSLTLIASTPCFVKKDNWLEAMDQKILEGFIIAYSKEPEITQDKFNYLTATGNKNSRSWIKELKSLSRSKVDPVALEQGLQILLKTDLRENIKELKTPALMIFGEKDSLIPVAVEKQIKSINPKIITEIIQNSGHIPFITETDQIVRLINEHVSRC
ncbi:MAG: alpha/beta fold hydrolase [Gammaproteobacteria bacterium]